MSKSKRKTAAAPPAEKAARWWNAGLFVLVVGVVLSGLSVVQSAHEMRGLYQQLGEVQGQQNTLAAEQSRLMLERGALSSMQNIEQIASTDLDMVFPQHVEKVLD